MRCGRHRAGRIARNKNAPSGTDIPTERTYEKKTILLYHRNRRKQHECFKKSGEVVIDLLSTTLTQTRLDYKKLKESYERLLQDQRDYNHDLPAMNTENQELKRQLAEQNNSWNARRIRNELTAGIIQGESMGKIANRFYSVMGSNRKAAVRNARTAVTSAQNGGRMDAMRRAMEQGYSAKKQWVATMDERTRLSHILLGGETVDANKPFSNGLMYPGDPDGDPSEVYNCRCTMVDADDRFRTAQDDELDAMYQAWKAEKIGTETVAKGGRNGII